jgi:hypothetical protein
MLNRGRVAAAAIDLLHDHARRGQPEAGATVVFGNHRRQPAGAEQRIDESLGIGALLVDPAEILVGELAAKVANGVADFLVFVGGVEHGVPFPGGRLGVYCWPGASGQPASAESDAD